MKNKFDILLGLLNILGWISLPFFTNDFQLFLAFNIVFSFILLSKTVFSLKRREESSYISNMPDYRNPPPPPPIQNSYQRNLDYLSTWSGFTYSVSGTTTPNSGSTYSNSGHTYSNSGKTYKEGEDTESQNYEDWKEE